jgi:hypothetical protein
MPNQASRESRSCKVRNPKLQENPGGCPTLLQNRLLAAIGYCDLPGTSEFFTDDYRAVLQLRVACPAVRFVARLVDRTAARRSSKDKAYDSAKVRQPAHKVLAMIAELEPFSHAHEIA